MKRILKIPLILTLSAFLILILILTISFSNTEKEKRWVITYGGPKCDCDSPYGIEKITDNEYLVTGTSNSFTSDGEDDALMIDIDKDGNLRFAKTFGKDGEDRLHKIQKTEDGDFIGVGYTSNKPGTEKDKDFLLVRFNKEGKIIWSKTLKGANDEIGYSITKTNDNNFVAVGWKGKITGENQDILAVKVNENGEILWAETFGTPDDEEQSYSVAPSNDGGVLILGKKGIERMEALGKSNLLLIKLSSEGNIEFAKTIGGDVYYYLISPTAIEKTEDGYLIAAETYNQESGKDGVIIRLDEDGNILWTKIIGTIENNERFRSAIKTEDQNYIAVGDLYNYEGSDGLLVKLNKEGEIIDSRIFSGENRGEVNRLDVIKEISEGVLISGKTNSYGAGFFDNVIMKIDKDYKNFKCELIKKEVNIFEKEEKPKENPISLTKENALTSMNFISIGLSENDVTEKLQSTLLCQ